jgi:hypothetical protein
MTVKISNEAGILDLLAQISDEDLKIDYEHALVQLESARSVVQSIRSRRRRGKVQAHINAAVKLNAAVNHAFDVEIAVADIWQESSRRGLAFDRVPLHYFPDMIVKDGVFPSPSVYDQT